MPVHFSYNYEKGCLDWGSMGEAKSADLSLEEAHVIAQSETAAALQSIALAIRQLSEKDK